MSTTSAARKFKLLLWKNYVLQKRKPIVTAVEIGCVAFFSVVLLLIRQRVKSTVITEPTTWKNFSVEKFPESLCPTSPLCGQPPKWQIFFTPNFTLPTDIMNQVQQQFGLNVVSGIVVTLYFLIRLFCLLIMIKLSFSCFFGCCSCDMNLVHTVINNLYESVHTTV